MLMGVISQLMLIHHACAVDGVVANQLGGNELLSALLVACCLC